MCENYGFEHVRLLCGWKNNTGLKEIECEFVDQIHLAQNGDK